MNNELRIKLKNHRTLFFILLIMGIGAILRFYKLDWGNGFYTHPDEYHIVASVNQLSFPYQMHPHFFSYGTFTIYLIYFTKELFHLSSSISHLPSPDVFLLGRFYSAFFSTLTILVVYKISRFFLDKPFALLAAFFVSITPGLIQQAHFTTPESNLIFFLFTSLLFLLYFLAYKKTHFLCLASVFFGCALGVKISVVVFLLPLGASIFLHVFGHHHSDQKLKIYRKILIFISLSSLSFIITFATLVIVAPYIFLDFPAFYGNIVYEGSLATGQTSVFYTRQFINTIPVLFQTQYILPFALGIPLLCFGFAGAFITLFFTFKKRGLMYIVFMLSFLTIFLSNGFLFTKWTRFIAPSLPFFSIWSAILLQYFWKKNRILAYACITVTIEMTLFWTLAFFSLYTKPDVRLTASYWLEQNLKQPATIVVEMGNMIDIPLEGNSNRVGFDFYNIEDDNLTREKIATGLTEADYFLIQSRRVFMNHQRLPKQFPKTARFYNALFNGSLGFEQIQQFDSYPQLSLFGFTIKFPDETAEETWSVFDHPVIRVYKKTNNLSIDAYAKIFE